MCAGQSVVVGVNDLATLAPDLAAQWDDPRAPDTFTAGSGYRAWWKCIQNPGHPRWTAAICGRAHGRGCPTCAGRNSAGERELAEYVQSLLPGVEIHRADRTVITPKEIDIFIPNMGIGIEYNGLYWHSEKCGKDRSYHVQKLHAARAAGVRLLTVWEDDWRDRREIVEGMIAARLGVWRGAKVYARQCTVVTVDRTVAKRFLDRTHLQGAVNGAYHQGLLSPEGELVAVLSTRRSGLTWTIERFATSCLVPGGFSKLLAGLRREIAAGGGGVAATFSDNDHSDGKLYADTGFTMVRETAPGYWYVNGGTRHHRRLYQINRFRRDPELIFREGLTERELAEVNGLVRVWGSGNRRWEVAVAPQVPTP